MNFNSIQLIGYGRIAPDPAWKMDKQRHPFHELVVIIHGLLHVDIGRESITAGPGDVLFYPARTVHWEWSDKQDPVETVFFSWSGPADQLPYLVRDTTGRIRLLATWLNEEKLSDYPQSKALQLAFFRALVAETIKSSVYHEPPLVGTIQKFIREHLREKLALEHLAAEASMSKYHFLRTYKQLTGRTPMDEVRRIRVESAKELVLATAMPLKDIAVKVGFCDEYYLSRMFRQYVGTSPRRFRSRKKI